MWAQGARPAAASSVDTDLRIQPSRHDNGAHACLELLDVLEGGCGSDSTEASASSLVYSVACCVRMLPPQLSAAIVRAHRDSLMHCSVDYHAKR